MGRRSKFFELKKVFDMLHGPDGCPWDKKQTFATIAPYTIEEAYELADAVRQDDPALVRDELGDVLFQVVFQSRIAEERGLFDFQQVAAAIGDKLERRHPHVFGTASVAGIAQQSEAWEAHKAAERREKGQGEGALDGVALGLPALTRAAKLGKRAARVGFDWPDVSGVLVKVDEEVAEVQAAVTAGAPDEVREELGDLLFSVVQAARHLGVDPEAALRDANAKFERRFRDMEARLAAQGRTVGECDPGTLEALWALAKRSVG